MVAMCAASLEERSGQLFYGCGDSNGGRHLEPVFDFLAKIRHCFALLDGSFGVLGNTSDRQESIRTPCLREHFAFYC